MNVEEQLSDALSARADLVAFDGAAYGAVVARRRRRAAYRGLRPVAAATAFVALAGLGVVLARTGEKQPVTPTTVSQAPIRGIAIKRYRAILFDPADLTKEPRLETLPTDGNVYAVTAVSNGEGFYFASQYTTKCKSALYRFTRSGTTPLPSGLWSNGYVAGLAVTPDERFLAYVTRENHLPGNKVEDCPVGYSVRIRDLLTGEERGWPITVKNFVSGDVTVSPDGRYVVYESDFTRFERIDTRTGEKVVVYDPEGAEVVTSSRGSCSVAAVSYLPTGELAAVGSCRLFGGESVRGVAVYDPVTRRFGRELFRLPATFVATRLDFDGSGRRALLVGREELAPSSYGYDNAVYRWDEGGEPRRVLEGSAEPVLTEPAW